MPSTVCQSDVPGRHLLVTCEHGGNRIPSQYAALFRGAARTLESHRGWDPGTLELSRFLGRYFRVDVPTVTWSRLLVEANRAPNNRRIWSEFTAGLPAGEKEKILSRYWSPHRRAVEARVVSMLAQGGPVVHIAVHSFVPVLGGQRRNADIGLLYDSRQPGESDFCLRWEELLNAMDPALRVRRNYPYKGIADGLPTWIRRRHPDDGYIGVELEVNQAMFSGGGKARVHQLMAKSLESLLINLESRPAPSG